MIEKKHILRIIALMLVQSAFVFAFWPSFLTDWDSYLYSAGAVTFKPVSLCLGRWLYCAFLGLVWRITGGQPWTVFTAVSAVAGVINIGLLAALTRRWVGMRAALIAAAIVASSAMMGMYAAAVMTEALSITAILLSLLILKPRTKPTIVAGICFGIAVAIREPTIFLLPAFLVLLWPSTRFGGFAIFTASCAAVVIFGWLGAVLTADDWFGQFAAWQAGMASQRAGMVTGFWGPLAKNVGFYLAYLALFSPVFVLALPAVVKSLRSQFPRWAVALVVGLGVYMIAEVGNHTIVFNPRFAILPGVLLSILFGKALAEYLEQYKAAGYAAIAIVALQSALLLAVWPKLDKLHFQWIAAAKQTYASLDGAGQNVYFVPGKFTPVVDYYKSVNSWRRIVYSGWEFDPVNVDNALKFCRENEGFQLLLVDKKYWPSLRNGPEEHRAYGQLAALGIGKSAVANFSTVTLKGTQSQPTAVPQESPAGD